MVAAAGITDALSHITEPTTMVCVTDSTVATMEEDMVATTDISATTDMADATTVAVTATMADVTTVAETATMADATIVAATAITAISEAITDVMAEIMAQ